jgi:amino acid adenylation domain-containing protein
LFDTVEDHARAHPDSPALVAGSSALSYHELIVRAEKLAREITPYGTTLSRQLVAILLDSSVEFVVAVLAVLRAGHAYLPLSKAQPTAVREAILADARPRMILTSRDLAATAPYRPPPHFDVWVESTTEPGLCSALRKEDAPPASAVPSDTLYAMYTSGTTGAPKGVLIPASGVPRLFTQPGYARFASDCRFLMLAPGSFDASNLEVWGALLNAGTLFLPDAPEMTVSQICEQVQRDQITTLWLAAGLFNLIIDTVPGGLHGVREIMVGGDVLSPDHIRRAITALPDTAFINGYGPTECTTFALCHRITPQDLTGSPIPIGRPIAETEVVILTEMGEVAEPGAAGELAIAGPGLAHGYLDRPGLTAARFIRLVSGQWKGVRFYRTGDLCRQRPDGVFDILGRIDDQVKILGQRVHLGEIARLLEGHPDVATAVALAGTATGGNQRLSAVIERRRGAQPTAADLRRHVRMQASQAHVPREIRFVDAMPLTPNGKVDREAVAALVATVDATPSGTPSYRHHFDTALTTIWTRNLGAGSSPTSDFFDAGGDSLAAMTLLVELEELTGQRLQLEDLFQAPTLERFRSRLLAGHRSPMAPHLVSIKPDGRDIPLVIVHGGGGGVMHFRGLAQRLPAEQPLYAMEGDWGAAEATPKFDIRELAGLYADEITAALPDGPLHLAGLCFGGFVAFEMAGILRAAGRRIENLILCDTPFVCGSATKMRLYLIGYRLGRACRALLRGQFNANAPQLSPFERRMTDAAARYRPSHYPGALHMLSGSSVSGTTPLRGHRGWAAMCRDGLTVHPVVGSRSAMFHPDNLTRTTEAIVAILSASHAI